MDDYRLRVYIRAVETILSATTLMSEDELDGDAETFGPDSEYDEDFMKRPTSYLVCSMPECRQKREFLRSYWLARRDYAPPEPTFFGSLDGLLSHQHKRHSKFRYRKKELNQRLADGG